MSDLITFERFAPGAVMGDATVVYDAELVGRWQAIFGGAPTGDGESGAASEAESAAEGASLAVVAMMRAYLAVVAPRPPGNVHARQQFALANVPRPGEAIRTVVACTHKEWRRERRYVELEVSGTGEAGRPIYTGRMTLIWAA